MQLYEIILISSPFIALGVVISFMIGLAFFMASRILNDSVIYNRGKEFFLSSIETIIIVFGIVILSLFFDSIFSSFMGCTSSCNPVVFAEIAINRTADIVFELYTVFYLFDVFVGPFLQSTISTGFGALSLTTTQLSFMPLVGLDIIMDFFYNIMQRIADILVFVIAREGLLQISIPLVAYIFPVAVILRSIPPTRRVGSSLFAIALVLYYVFPISVLFSDYLTFNAYKTDLVKQKNYNTDLAGSSDYISKGTLQQYEKTQAEIEDQLEEQQQRVVESITAVPIGRNQNERYTVEEALSKVAGASLSQVSARGKVLIYTMINSALAGLLSNTRVGGYAFILTKLFALFFYTSYIQGLLMTFSPFEWAADLFNAFIVLSAQVAQISIIVFITLVLEILISITSYRAIAKMLRGDVTMLGLTKVI